MKFQNAWETRPGENTTTNPFQGMKNICKKSAESPAKKTFGKIQTQVEDKSGAGKEIVYPSCAINGM